MVAEYVKAMMTRRGDLMSARHRPSWIALSPARTSDVRRVAERVWQERSDIAFIRPWESWGIVDGRKGYVALYDPEPVVQFAFEDKLCAELSKQLPGRHYGLRLAI